MRTIGGIKIPEKDTYRVDSTFDYGKFKFIEGNRDVDHEKKLEESMREITGRWHTSRRLAVFHTTDATSSKLKGL